MFAKNIFLTHKTYIQFVFGILLLFSVENLHSQINTNKFKVDLTSLNFNTCSDANNGLSTIKIQSKQATATDFKIAFELPPGVYYQQTSAVITTQSGSNDFTLVEFDVTDLNQPIFSIERTSNSPWQINDTVTFTIAKTADCDAVQYYYGGGLFKDKHTISFNDDSGSATASDTELSTNSYVLLSPFIAVDNLTAEDGLVGETTTRNVVIKNSGNGKLSAFEHVVEISDELLANYSLTFDGDTLNPTSTSGNFKTYYIDINAHPFTGKVGDGDAFFENESITLVETLILETCKDDQYTKHSPRWGCSSGVYCQTGSFISGSYNAQQTYPNITLAATNNPTPRLDAPVTYSYIVSNDASADTAYNVQINIGIALNGTLSYFGYNPLKGDDDLNQRKLSNFNFTGGSAFTPQRWENTEFPGLGLGSYYIPPDFFRTDDTDPDGFGGLEDLDGDGFYDDLAPGSQTVINIDLEFLPVDPGCIDESVDYLHSEEVVIDAWSTNKCNNNFEANRQEFNRSYIISPSIFDWDDPEDYDRDAEEGSVFYFNYREKFNVSSEAPTCNGTKLLSNDLSTKYESIIIVPNGISLDAGADPRYSQTGNIITFTETNLADFVYNSYRLDILVNFPLNIDCSTYSGPAELEITYSSNYESDCFDRELHCGVFKVQTHCTPSCSGPKTTSFDANRVTAGWTDETMSTKVVLDPSVHNTKFYMPKDEMVVTTSAVMDGPQDNLEFEMFYVTDYNAGSFSDIIEFTNGTITINDLSSGSPQTFPITTLPIISNGGVNENYATFNLSSYQQLISPTYTYGEGNQQDEISLELHFKVKDNFPKEAILYQFYTFEGKFSSVDGGGVDVECDLFTDRAFFVQTKINTFFADNNFVTGCDVKYISAGLRQISGLDDQFPNEFRPPLLFNSVTLEIPEGMHFIDDIGSDYPDIQPFNDPPTSDNGGLLYSVSGNIITVTPGPNFVNFDQGNNNYPEIYFGFIGTSEAPTVSTYVTSFTYTEYAYSDSPAQKTESEAATFSYFLPQFYLNSTELTVLGNSLIEGFTVDICKSSGDIIANNWLSIDTSSEYTITDAYLVDGATETPLNTQIFGDKTIIEFGDMEEGWTCKQIRFEGTYYGENTKTIEVQHNYDCISYPTDYSSSNSFNELLLSLIPANASIQLNILEQPIASVGTCDDFLIELEVRNAGEGDLTNPKVTFDIPGEFSSLNLEELTVEYPRNSGNIQIFTPTITGNTIELDLLQHSIISANLGIYGSNAAPTIDDQIAIVSLTLNPQCNYRSNTGTSYIATGGNPYGESAEGSGSKVASNPIIITGAEPPYSTNSIAISSPNFEGCTQETVSIETYIVDGVSGANDYTRIILPIGLNYVTGTFVSTGTVTTTLGSVVINGDHEELTINLPSGADSTNKIAYSFDVETTPEICAGDYEIALETYVTVTGLTCDGVACGMTEVVTGEASTMAGITKAALQTSSFTPQANYYQTGTDNQYVVAFGVENTGTEDLPIGLAYNVYCADASGVKTGSSIYSGATTQEITAGNSIEETATFTTTNFCGANSKIVVEFSPSTSNCFCTPVSIVIDSAPSTDFADLRVEMSTTSTSVNAGDTVDIVINVYNDGPLNATNVDLVNYVPSGFTLVAASDSGTLTGNTISWPSFDVTNGSFITYTITVSINNPTNTALEFQSISEITASDQIDPDSTPNNYDGTPLEDDESILILDTQEADLSLAKSISNNTPNVGDTVTFTIALANSGPDDATGVAVEDVVPVGYSTISAISNGGTLTGNTISWSAIAVPTAGVSLTYTAVVNAPTGATDEYKNIAQVTASDQYDPDSTPNNDDGDQSEDDEDSNTMGGVPTADLSLAKSISNNTPNVGDTVTFTIALANSGPDDATGVAVEDVVPVGYSTISAISNGGTLTGNTISWSAIAVPTAGVSLTYTAVVNAPTGATDEYKNIAQVTASDQTDPDSTPNNDDGDQSEDDEDAVTDVTPNLVVDLEISKSVDESIAKIDDTVVFTVTVENIGNVETTGIEIEEQLPDGFELISETTSHGSYDNTLHLWEIPILAPGQTASLNLTVKVVVGESYTNVALLSLMDQIDINPINDRDEATVTIEEEKCLIIFNEFSPNQDGANDVFFIECINQYPNNVLTIYNRWGTKVYETNGYNNTWDGTSQARATTNASEKLPVGTYYYTLELGDGTTENKSGWLYLSR